NIQQIYIKLAMHPELSGCIERAITNLTLKLREELQIQLALPNKSGRDAESTLGSGRQYTIGMPLSPTSVDRPSSVLVTRKETQLELTPELAQALHSAKAARGACPSTEDLVEYEDLKRAVRRDHRIHSHVRLCSKCQLLLQHMSEPSRWRQH